MTATAASGFSLAVGRPRGAVVVTVHSEIGATAASVLRDILTDLIEGQGNLTIVVDLGGTPKIHAAGITVLAAAARIAHRQAGMLRVIGAAAAPRAALEAAGFTLRVVDLTGPVPILAAGRGPQIELRFSPRRLSMGQHPAGSHRVC